MAGLSGRRWASSGKPQDSWWESPLESLWVLIRGRVGRRAREGRREGGREETGKANEKEKR